MTHCDKIFLLFNKSNNHNKQSSYFNKIYLLFYAKRNKRNVYIRTIMFQSCTHITLGPEGTHHRTAFQH
uniref:Uncharacterized protein n=1 Tax=Arundo donax TaxID=35708 RepID=A0A0A9ARF5_ARUDO